MSATKSDIVKTAQKKEDLQPIPKGRIGALGSGIPFVPSKTADDEETTKSYVDKVEHKKDILQPSPKVTKEDK